MSNKLKQLSDDQKRAVVALACLIEAQGKGGRFRSNDPEMDIIIRDCFDDDWIGSWNNDFRHTYLGNAAMYAVHNQDECIGIVAALDMEAKYAFKNMMIDIIGDNAMMVLAAAFIYKKIGIPAFTPPKERETPRVERNTQEDDGTYVLEDPYYRLAEVGAVRGDNDRVFTMVDYETGESFQVGANYDYWLSEGICPVNGVVGYVDPHRSISTPEGTLCYLVCTGNLVVPVLDWGLEKIDEWSYRERVQNNRMISCDKNSRLCNALRDMDKPSGPTTNRKKEDVPTDKQVIHFVGTVQQRIEGGVPFTPSYIERHISLTYTKRGAELRLEVVGVMQPRIARFKNDNGRILTYEDTTRPFTYYEVETEPVHNSIVRISIFQKNDKFEDIEYRYTIDR